MSMEVTTNDNLPRVEAARFAELAPGTIVGEYEIDQKLGRGGMGLVYSAIHPVIGKRAAIKVLHPELSVNQEAVDRFVQEARSVNKVGHANIIDIFAFGQLPDGRCYFVMELLRGETLRDRTLRGPLPLDELLDIVETITLALDAAHAHGIVHRDLKPDNIFLAEIGPSASLSGPVSTRPIVKLLDFGIAKLLGQDSLNQTNTGNLLGTPPYLSPEQAKGGSGVDHRTDVYALGAVMFELLTGEFVFQADSGAEMIAKHLYESPRAASTIARVPPALDALMLRMLAKNPDERPTLAQVRGAIAVARQQGAEGIVAAPTQSKPRIWLIAAIALATIGIGLGIVIAMRGDETKPATPAVAPTVQMETKLPPPIEAPSEPPVPPVEPTVETKVGKPETPDRKKASTKHKPRQSTRPPPPPKPAEITRPKIDDDDAPLPLRKTN